jgi:mRNA-degrading endonuclease YafQ of YafQ-DinJ toxin-antitoxin module
MPYKVSHRPSFARDLKDFKKSKQQKEAILSAVESLIANPLRGKQMSGQWNRFFNFSFMDKPELRILYVVYPCCPLDIKEKNLCRFDDLDIDPIENTECLGLIEFVFVRTREACNNLYAKDKSYIKDFFLEK